MSKVIKVIAIVAVAVAIIVFAAPLAAGIAGAFSAVGVTVATAGIVSALVGIGVSLALTAVGTLFRKAPNLSQSMADRLQKTVNPTANRKIVFGRTAAGLDTRFEETYGSKKDRFAQVIALASHKVTLQQVWLEDTLTWSNGVLVAHQDGILGFQAVSEGKPGNGFAYGSGSYWRNTATFTGCSYFAITYKLDNKAWPQSIPAKMTAIVEGCPVYDPRSDSTAGGSGSHRWDDQATWQYRNNAGVEIGRNPALSMLTYLIGYKIAGKLAWGMGMPISRINLDNFKVYANVCEERVATQAGSTVQRYTADGIYSTADPHETVINGISAAMGSCKLTDVGGVYGFVGGYDDSLGPIQSFNADDLVGAVGTPTPYTWIPSGPARETYNIVRGRFANPDELYQLADWGVVETAALPDGIPRTLQLDLGMVSRAETCQRIAKQFLMREAITPGFFSATFGPRAFTVQVGSLIRLSLPSQGWNGKLFRVIEQHETHDLMFPMTLREEDPLIYAWDREEKPLPAVIRPPGYDASMTITPTGLRLSSVTYQGVS
ncbi:hypothetical protein [Sphingomonas sp. NFX23]|uniref:hypothetical protein n=1 Tax=Sphingomonas sp. NFX23 TaxID=2819532 RepID=UPI003CF129C5